MTENKLKYSIGMLLLVLQIFIFGYAGYLFLSNGFSMNEFTTIVAIITPIFSGYITSFLRFVIKNAKVFVDTTDKVSTIYSTLSFGFPIVLAAVMLLAIDLKAHNKVFDNFEDFKRFLLLMESLFSGYAGMFILSLFDHNASNRLLKK